MLAKVYYTLILENLYSAVPINLIYKIMVTKFYVLMRVSRRLISDSTQNLIRVLIKQGDTAGYLMKSQKTNLCI